VTRDPAESWKWLSLAALEAEEGDTDAADLLKELEAVSELTAEAKAAACEEAEKLYKQIFGEEEH